MKGKKTVSFSSIENMKMVDFASLHGCLGSSNVRAIPNGPLLSVFDYKSQNRRIRSDKGFSLRAIEDISPNKVIARFIGDVVPTVSVTDEIQSILLCNNMSMIRPSDDSFLGKHIAWCANDARFEEREKNAKNNAKISGYGQIRNGQPTAVSIVSTKKIWANEEIFCNYGRIYKVVQKANALRKSGINKSIETLRVHDQRERRKAMREKKGLVPLKRGRPKKWCKNQKIEK